MNPGPESLGPLIQSEAVLGVFDFQFQFQCPSIPTSVRVDSSLLPEVLPLPSYSPKFRSSSSKGLPKPLLVSSIDHLESSVSTGQTEQPFNKPSSSECDSPSTSLPTARPAPCADQTPSSSFSVPVSQPRSGLIPVSFRTCCRNQVTLRNAGPVPQRVCPNLCWFPVSTTSSPVSVTVPVPVCQQLGQRPVPTRPPVQCPSIPTSVRVDSILLPGVLPPPSYSPKFRSSSSKGLPKPLLVSSIDHLESSVSIGQTEQPCNNPSSSECDSPSFSVPVSQPESGSIPVSFRRCCHHQVTLRNSGPVSSSFLPHRT